MASSKKAVLVRSIVGVKVARIENGRQVKGDRAWITVKVGDVGTIIDIVKRGASVYYRVKFMDGIVKVLPHNVVKIKGDLEMHIDSRAMKKIDPDLYLRDDKVEEPEY